MSAVVVWSLRLCSPWVFGSPRVYKNLVFVTQPHSWHFNVYPIMIWSKLFKWLKLSFQLYWLKSVVEHSVVTFSLSLQVLKHKNLRVTKTDWLKYILIRHWHGLHYLKSISNQIQNFVGLFTISVILKLSILLFLNKTT